MKIKLMLTAAIVPLILAGCNSQTNSKSQSTEHGKPTVEETAKVSSKPLAKRFMGSYVAYTSTVVKENGRDIGIIKTPMVIHIKDRNIYSGFGQATIENTHSQTNETKLRNLAKYGLITATYGLTNYQLALQDDTSATIQLINNSGLWPDKKSQFKNPRVNLKLMNDGKQLTLVQTKNQISAATNPSYAMNIPTANRDKNLIAVPETDTAGVTFSRITDQQGEKILKQRNLQPSSQGYGKTKTTGSKDTTPQPESTKH